MHRLRRAFKLARLYYLAWRLGVDSLELDKPIRMLESRSAHMIASEIQASWLEKLEFALGIELPNAVRTWRIHIVVGVATVQVVAIIYAASQINPKNILIIPIFCVYTAAMLAFRQYRIDSMARAA